MIRFIADIESDTDRFHFIIHIRTIQFPKIVHLPDKLNKVYDSETFRNLNKVANLIWKIFYWGILTSWPGWNKNLKLQFHKNKFCDISPRQAGGANICCSIQPRSNNENF